ncbi:MAG: hypothetical protein OZSIB_2531 [Candidatus Ozemobacter sibiricus]|uniref:Uncharacterized protein n=1 Tax=Candidatus Ozemobacter sibiricus TaxID=2268124 RepID=A0A367ZSM8_9BACT|nr:MAG: hypothetical protein OZSIB_2531 [Candidatus Ozemobacter sibiricus]
MTDLVMEWIQREIEKLTRDPLLKALYADSGLPTRSFSKRQLDEFARADAATPKELQEWARKSLKKGKPK